MKDDNSSDLSRSATPINFDIPKGRTMTISSDILSGPRLKVAQAGRHIEAITNHTSPLPEAWYSLEVRPAVQVPLAHSNLYDLTYRPREPIAESIALMIGDALHNLRGALDHLATGIRRLKKGTGNGHFPMRKHRHDLVLPSGKPIPDLQVLEEALPGARDLLLNKLRPANGDDEALWSFSSLNNDDKHNDILPTIAVSNVQNLNITTPRLVANGLHVRGSAAGPIKIYRGPGPITLDERIEVYVEATFGKNTPFENEPVEPTLRRISVLVTSVLDEFEALIKQSS